MAMNNLVNTKTTDLTIGLDDFKAKVADHLTNLDLRNLEVKEIKDIVNIMLSIENSISKPQDDTKIVNIIQNLVTKYDI